MRLTKVHFHAYKRLLDTGCNIDAPLIALLGPNEAGKTSVLEALHWFSTGGPLDPHKISRAVELDYSGPIVTGWFRLEQTDLEVVSEIDTDVTPRHMVYSRYRDGNVEVHFEPSLTRTPRFRNEALELLNHPDVTTPSEGTDIPSLFKYVRELAKSGREWRERAFTQVSSLIRWLEQPINPEEPVNTSSTEGESAEPILETPQADRMAAEALKVWLNQMKGDTPEDEAADALSGSIPKFVQFSEGERALGHEYDLSAKKVNGNLVFSDDVKKPPAALSNLLALGNTNIEKLSELSRAGVIDRTSTHLRKVNKLLDKNLSTYWKQRDIQVRIDINATKLHIFVDDNEDTARFSDRSEGLRIFVALIAFLQRYNTTPAPMLLIDEADMHLHYNAQADLITQLSELPLKTIYTTHSPGCLPRDLGTGIRLVQPDQEQPVSTLKNNFWTSNEAGFSPLLFAMGASAAAFSALRDAVFVEGPSDMILLPSLIRAATGKKTLSYQIVPGLANLSPTQLKNTTYEAVRIAYLLDGDEGGNIHTQNLTGAGVPSNLIQSLPTGYATEDLLDERLYLETINSILEDSPHEERVDPVEITSLREEGRTVSKAVELLLGKKAPGKTIVANRIIHNNDERQILNKKGEEYLRELDSKFELIFSD